MEFRLVTGSGMVLLLLFATSLVAAPPESGIEFNRDVRPILADHCFQCHGPDAKQRKADLRLDTAEAAAPDRKGGPVVIAGQPEKSELWRRITSADADERMPPPQKGTKLTAAETATLKHWIIEGAKFEKHWSLLPVRQPPLPRSFDHKDANDTIDTFILARLEKENIAPSPPADRPTLFRRVTLALTGVPPTPDEIEAFLRDPAADAYERVVDRLLASPRFGERMSVPWLDAARYADTSGYQSDGERFMWRWRDWVIEALNANMPFDQFTIEQLAGDLLPQATLAQRIATGFNRNHRGNAEGGIIPEEYAVEYVADRVETTATVWLGLTLGCARCHDHKYDPFTQRDFYSLFAFFNNVPEKGRAIKFGNSPPYITAPTRQQMDELARLKTRAALAQAKFAEREKELSAGLAEWERTAAGREFGDWVPDDQLVAHWKLDGDLGSLSQEAGRCSYESGVVNQAAKFDGSTSLSAGNQADFGFYDKFTLSAWIRASAGGGGTILSRMADFPQGEGYQLTLVGGKLQFNLVKRWLDDSLRVETGDALSPDVWHHVVAIYDGSRVADGVTIYVDGEPQRVSVLLDELNQSFGNKEPLRIGGGGGPDQRFCGLIDEVRIYSGALSPDEAKILATPQTLEQISAIPREKRTAGQQLKLASYYLERVASDELRSANMNHKATARELAAFAESLPTVMVMEEMARPRETHLLVRGQYDKPGERVEPNVPGELPALPNAAPRDRLALARWLVAPKNPLASRVIVNRAWQLHFGTGIVKTAEDFGRQGEWPTHPELLDWLAAEFIHKAWDVKRLHRSIVTSGPFRRSSEYVAADPENRLLARGPRLRLSAEMVRDQALFASGLLEERVGGPSVRPWQPAGLWSELTGGDDYQPGSGADLVRRSLYTFWKRTIPPPTLGTFDSPSREACTVRQSRTNTPLQALALLNEPTFVAAAKALAERVMRESEDPNERIARAMLCVVSRRPTVSELSILKAALDRHRGHGPNGDELAAYTLICSTIINLDEAITSQ
jgi:hypothetical protein